MYTRTSDGRFFFVVIRGDMQLSEEKLARAIGDFRLATDEEIFEAGAQPGYASPIGLKKDALIVVDDLIPAARNLVAGANEAGYHLRNTNYGRDYVAELVVDLTLAGPGDSCPVCGEPLSVTNAELLANAQGICVADLLEALAETHHDEKGLTLPVAAAPFDVYFLHLQGKEIDTLEPASRLYAAWEQAGISVLFDDRNERAGVKFADADLIGCPVRATLGEKGMKSEMVELKARVRGESMMVAFDEALDTIRALIQRAP